MSDRGATTKIMRHLYKNPGVWDSKRLAEETGYSRGTCQNVLRVMAEMDPKVIVAVNQVTFLVRPPAYEEVSQEPQPEPKPLPLMAGPSAPEPEFIEILPDDDEIYPPFRIRIYDHFTGKRHEQWFRVKDETGKRGIFRWIDDE